jgi:hypothetical protein
MPWTTDTCAVPAACAGDVANVPATSSPATAMPTKLNRFTIRLRCSSLGEQYAAPSVMDEYVRTRADGFAEGSPWDDPKPKAVGIDQTGVDVAQS